MTIEDDQVRALRHLNGAREDAFTGRRYGRAVALHRMRSPLGKVRLALVCDCGAYFDATVDMLANKYHHCDGTAHVVWVHRSP